MPRYIDADALRKSLEDWFEYFDWDDGEIEKHTIATVIRTIDSQPTADVRENVHGKWIVKDESYWRPHHSGDIPVNKAGLYCSECDKRLAKAQKYRNFCPNCGAEMQNARQELVKDSDGLVKDLVNEPRADEWSIDPRELEEDYLFLWEDVKDDRTKNRRN